MKQEITARLPAGRIPCFDNTELPMVIRKILTANANILEDLYSLLEVLLDADDI